MDGKKGKLEGKVDIKREGGKVTIEASGATTYAKRYFKYLTKKYLKKCVCCGGREAAGERRRAPRCWWRRAPPPLLARARAHATVLSPPTAGSSCATTCACWPRRTTRCVRVRLGGARLVLFISPARALHLIIFFFSPPVPLSAGRLRAAIFQDGHGGGRRVRIPPLKYVLKTRE